MNGYSIVFEEVVMSIKTGSKFFLSLVFLYATCSYAEVKQIGTDQEFAMIAQSGKPVVIKFYADWCGACKAAKQPFEELSQEPELSMVDFADVNVDLLKDIANQYINQGVPTFVYFKDGKPVDKTVGAGPKNKLRDDIKKNLMSASLMEQADVTVAENQVPNPAPVEKQGIMTQIKNFFAMLFTGIKNVLVGIVNWIKGLFGK